ncbi:putative galacturonosyltransferase 5 [Wolffia australiana]
MKGRSSQRIVILSLLGLTVLSPVIFLYNRISGLPQSSDESIGRVEDVSSSTYKSDGVHLNSLLQEGGGVEEPAREIFKESSLVEPVGNESSTASVRVKSATIKRDERISGGNEKATPKFNESAPSQRTVNRGVRGGSPRSSLENEKIFIMWDQVIMARAYLQFAPPNSNSRLVRELKIHMKEIKSILSQATKDSDLPRSALQKMRAMDGSLSRAGRAYPDCTAMVAKLRSMMDISEEQLTAQKRQVSFLMGLAPRTISKGLHCLSMTLTSQYFELKPEARGPTKKAQARARRSDLYHVAIFSDNVLACSVVVKSMIASSTDPSKLVFHVVTNPLSYPAMVMWFLVDQPSRASVHVASTEDFDFLNFDFDLDRLRFFLPQIFPFLRRVLLLDHDVVVRRDMAALWSIDFKGKVNAAVETSLRLGSLLDLSDPAMGLGFDPESLAWTFGVNVFDLDRWRRMGLTEVYHNWSQLAVAMPTWRPGTLQLGLLTFYNQTRLLRRRWHLRGLGHAPGRATKADVEAAAVVHYDGGLKPWLELGLPQYKAYWTQFVNYAHPLLRQCNIHD